MKKFSIVIRCLSVVIIIVILFTYKSTYASTTEMLEAIGIELGLDTDGQNGLELTDMITSENGEDLLVLCYLRESRVFRHYAWIFRAVGNQKYLLDRQIFVNNTIVPSVVQIFWDDKHIIIISNNNIKKCAVRVGETVHDQLITSYPEVLIFSKINTKFVLYDENNNIIACNADFV